MRILVTGAAGYVGGVVTARLVEAGHDVTALGRSRSGPTCDVPGVVKVVADLRDPAQVRAARLDRGFDGVCHLAALTRVRDSRLEPLNYFNVNVGGTVHLLKALARGTDRTGVAPAFVLASSCAVYGEARSQPLAETMTPEPSHPYGASKVAAEQVVTHQAATGRIGAVVLRSFNVAGAVGGHGDTDATRIIPAALAAAAGLTEAVGVNGDGTAVREYVHVADIADAYVAALSSARPGLSRVYNVGSGTGVSVREVLDAVDRVTGRTIRRITRPPAPEPAFLVADSSRVRAELGWDAPRSTIDQIVADAWDWVTRRAPATAPST